MLPWQTHICLLQRFQTAYQAIRITAMAQKSYGMIFLVIFLNCFLPKMHQMDNKYLFSNVMIVDDDSMDRLLTATVVKRHAFAEEVRDFSSVFAALTWLQSLKRQDGP